VGCANYRQSWPGHKRVVGRHPVGHRGLTSLAPVAALVAVGTPVPDLVPAGGGAASGATVTGGAARPPARPSRPLSPRLAACCEIAMGVTMGYVLITML